MKLRTALFIYAGLVCGPLVVFSSPSIVAASPLPSGYFPVGFNSGAANLTPGAKEFINDISHAAVNYGDRIIVRDEANNLVISGCDRTLSDRRAKAIAAELVTFGIPKAIITIYYVDKFHTDFSSEAEILEYNRRHVVILAPYTEPPPPPPGVIELP